jgi:hypothetical protein
MEKRKDGMREQSHIDAMREAVRGDLERARNRRPSIFERPAPPPLEIREDPSPLESEPVAVAVAVAVEPEPEPEPVAEPPIVEEPPAAPRRRFRLAFWR